MIGALIRGRMRNDEHLEDVLTSSMFGMFRYVPWSQGLEQFLRRARRIDDSEVLLDLAGSLVSLEFWPWYEAAGVGAEPDLVLHMEDEKGARSIWIEAKLYSGKSSHADSGPEVTDQLARQLALLGERDALVYLTAHPVIPRRDLVDALDELQLKRGASFADRVWWLSWHDLPEALGAVTADSAAHRRLRDDLGMLARRYGFGRFHGFAARPQVRPAAWRFERANPFRISWHLPARPPRWRFTPKAASLLHFTVMRPLPRWRLENS